MSDKIKRGQKRTSSQKRRQRVSPRLQSRIDRELNRLRAAGLRSMTTSELRKIAALNVTGAPFKRGHGANPLPGSPVQVGYVVPNE